ncbi:MAG: hypothetical protein KA715_07295 [Xanthomonadaceae bacterium]|nr:hypothetical protein [Xanthomonadaceae bacterium]
MKALAVVMMAGMILGSQVAKADGFICEDYDQTLKIKVFHNVMAKKGTRNAAKLIVSDPRVANGRKTIATFDQADGLLTSKELVYTADVDLRYKNSSRKGELIGGTKLGEIDFIELFVDFSYNQPLKNFEEADAFLRLTKRSGKELEIDLVCARYLKN